MTNFLNSNKAIIFKMTSVMQFLNNIHSSFITKNDWRINS